MVKSNYRCPRCLCCKPVPSLPPEINRLTSNSSNMEVMAPLFPLSCVTVFHCSPEINEPRYEKTVFLHMRKQRRRSAAQLLISAFVFAIRIVQSLFYLNPKFQASSHLLWQYSPIFVAPGRKHRIPVFSHRGSNHLTTSHFVINDVT